MVLSNSKLARKPGKRNSLKLEYRADVNFNRRESGGVSTRLLLTNGGREAKMQSHSDSPNSPPFHRRKSLSFWVIRCGRMWRQWALGSKTRVLIRLSLSLTMGARPPHLRVWMSPLAGGKSTRKTALRFKHDHMHGCTRHDLWASFVYSGEVGTEPWMTNRPSTSETTGKWRESTTIITDYIHTTLHFIKLYCL